MESRAHLVRSRLRMFLRNTWLVTILGTAIVAGGVDARLVEFLAKKFAHDRETVKPIFYSSHGLTWHKPLILFGVG